MKILCIMKCSEESTLKYSKEKSAYIMLKKIHALPPKIKNYMFMGGIVFVNILFFIFMNKIHPALLSLFVLILIPANFFFVIFVKSEFNSFKNIYISKDFEIFLTDMPISIPVKNLYTSDHTDSNEHLAISELDNSNKLKTELKSSKFIDHQNLISLKTSELVNYCNDFVLYLNENGVYIDVNEAREIFSAMAASRLIVLRNENVILLEKLVKLFSKYIGANYFFEDNKGDYRNYEELLVRNTNFRDFYEKAHHEKQDIHLVLIEGIDLKNSKNYLKEISTYAKSPLLPVHVATSLDIKYHEMPQNIWYFMIQNDFIDNEITKDILQSGIVLEINSSKIEFIQEKEIKKLKLSYETMTNFLFDGYESYYIEEDDWKKIDQIELYFKSLSDFILDNRIFRQLERYTSTFLMFGGDRKEAIDRVMFSKLLQIILTAKLEQTSDKKDDVLLLFEKLFGLENLNKSKKLLKKIHEMIELA